MISPKPPGNIVGLMDISNNVSRLQRTEDKLAADLWFFESMDRINRVMQSTDNLEQMMTDVLDTMLSIFECDRAFLATPCDPDATEFTIAMERTTPQYPGACARGMKVPMSPAVRGLFYELLENPVPNEIYVGNGLDPEDIVWKTYEIKSQLAIALFPKVGDAWECGMHQCSYNRMWNPEEKKLFLEISRRLGDILTSIMAYDALRKLNEELEERVLQRTAELTRANNKMRREISERERAEAERDAVEIQLRQAQKLEAIGQLAAGIAHEINTPIQFIGDNMRFIQQSVEDCSRVFTPFAEMLEAARNEQLTKDHVSAAENAMIEADLDYLAGEVPAAIDQTLDGISRITTIVKAMKEFSHPGAKEIILADLNRAIENTATVASNEWKHVADLKLDLDPQLPPVPCYVNDINQALLNLIINAAHAIADIIETQPNRKGLITITSRSTDGQVEIRVTDNGTGIPDEIHSRLFDPFFTTKQVGRGSGQGLSVAYNSIAKHHNGSITFDTEIDKGTTFIIRLSLESPPSDA
jgi:signal transduction histidine kinase